MAWADNDYIKRKKVTVTNTFVSGSLRNFPVPIDVTDSDLTVCNANGFDIVFYNSSNTTQLNHERVSFDNSTGALVAWVQTQTISSSKVITCTGNTFWMYYDYDGEDTDSSTSNTWDSDFLSVYHMEDLTDSTSNGYDLKNPNSTPIDSNGMVGNCYDFTAGSSHYMSSSFYDLSTLTEASIEYWIKPDAATEGGIYLGSGQYQSTTLHLRYRADNKFDGGYSINTSNRRMCRSHEICPINNWYHVFITCVDSAGSKTERTNLYTNGFLNEDEQYNDNGDPQFSGFLRDELWIGSVHDSDYFDGLVDEVRVSKVKRSYDWIWTTYTSISSTSFLSYDSQESGGIPAMVLTGDLTIFYDTFANPNYISCRCSRWDVQNYNVIVETWMKKSDLQTLRNNITPQAVGELYNILGKPRYYDKTWQGNNTIKLTPNTSHHSNLSKMRDGDTLIFVKNISDSPVKGPSGWINCKIEGMISGQGAL